MYELIILALLLRAPFHGYLIVKIANDMIGPWAKISSGTLYPLLNRMEQAGLITTLVGAKRQAGARQARTFMITEEGRKRFHQLMLDMSSNLGDYPRLFHFKVSFMDPLASNERLLLFQHYINYCQTSILHLQTERANLVHELTQQSHQVFVERVVKVMEHVEAQMQLELEWVRGLRAEELAREESPSSTTPANTANQTLDQR